MLLVYECLRWRSTTYCRLAPSTPFLDTRLVIWSQTNRFALKQLFIFAKNIRAHANIYNCTSDFRGRSTASHFRRGVTSCRVGVRTSSWWCGRSTWNRQGSWSQARCEVRKLESSFYRETAVRSEIRGMSSLQVCVVESDLEPARMCISKFSLWRWIRVELVLLWETWRKSS